MTVDGQGSIEFISAVLVASEQPERLSAFYRDVLGVPLAEERHGDAPPHWACELGDVHFAIHLRHGHWVPGPIRIAFWVFDLPAFATRLEATGVALLYPVRNLGPTSLVTAIRDPDGNEVELTQMGDDWIAHLSDRRRSGTDIISRATSTSD